MKVAIIGRTEVLYDTAALLQQAGHRVVCIITAKEAPEYTRTAEDFAALAVTWGVPFVRSACIAEHRELLLSSGAEIGVSMNYPGIVPQSVLADLPHGILNAHGGDLPRYRGNACQAWAILNGESHIGLCIHKMVGGELDSGDIITRDYLGIDHTTKVTRVWDWLRQRIPELMLQAVNALAADPDFVLERQSSNPKDALRCYPRRPEDGRINWQQSALQVLRLINASNKPYAGAYCNFEDQKMIIWDATLGGDHEAFCAVPGQITLVGNGFVEVACGEGKLRFLTVQVGDEIAAPDRWVRSIRARLS